jgi:hypothetical protein
MRARSVRLIPQIIVVGLLVAYVALYLFFSSPFDEGSRGADFSAYWEAANRLRLGQPLYPHLVDQQANDVYRYAAWFALAWLPFTALSRNVVEVAWIGLLMVASAYLLYVILRERTLAAACLAMLIGPWLIENAWVGQVHTLLVAILTLTLDRRAGPLAVGIAASLKLSPLAFAGWYAFQRQWYRAALAVGVFLALAATSLLFDLSNYPTDASEVSLASTSGVVWAMTTAVVVACALWISAARPRYRLFAAGVVASVALPRIHHISSSFLLPALAHHGEPTPQKPSAKESE